VSRLFRPHFALALSLLLLGMQLEGPLHALTHVGEALGHSPDHSLLVPNDEPCAECTLLAAGASALASAADAGAAALAFQERPQPAPVSNTPAFSSCTRIRGPPVLL
jgi:hypothetical protein